MALIQDPTTAVAVKVSAAGGLHITSGGDGFPTYLVAAYVPRITTALAVNSILWGMRAPATRTIEIRNGHLRLSLDTATTGEVGFEMVRFSTSDLAGGSLAVARPKNTAEATAQTVNIRAATATAGLTGGTLEASANALLHMTMPFQAGANGDMRLDDWTGLLLAPGEGLCLRTSPTAFPIGASLSGWVEFSERT